MSWYPQIGAGSIAQFPLTAARQWRAIKNELESGEQLIMPDTPSTQMAWTLSYTELNDTEVNKLNGLFAASQGSWGQFGFVDPLANLIGWSEDLTRPDWQAGLISITGDTADPNGNTKAWTLTNGTPGSQQLLQTLGISGDYTACFSVWLRSASGGSVVLQRDSVSNTIQLTSAWKRVFVSGAGSSGSDTSAFSIGLNAGQSVQIFGMQVEAQPYPSQYKTTSAAAGIYEQTWFAQDELKIVKTGPGLSSCQIKLLSRI